MTERRRAPIEVLERLAEAVDTWDSSVSDGAKRDFWVGGVLPALKVYRAATAPLRTRAAKALDVLDTLERYLTVSEAGEDSRPLASIWLHLEELIGEPTAPNSGPSSADTEEVPSPRPPVSPAGADLFQRVELLERYLGPSALEWARSQMPSGPASVAAAKESTDNAAAPEGAALKGECDACGAVDVLHRAPLRDGNSHKRLCLSCMHRVADAFAPADRECNCDQALHLERRIGDAVRAIRRSSLIAAGLRHELLGILEGEA